MRIAISEPEFYAALAFALDSIDHKNIDFVTGPGRSGSVASAYASHMVGIPFIPWNNRIPEGSRVLMIDTASQTGKTMRKAVARYKKLGYDVTPLAIYDCPDTHFVFWFEGY